MIDCFIADLHLQESSPDLTEEFVGLTRALIGRAERLFILGDLFEYWIGDDAASPLADEVAGALRAVAESGCAIYFMAGNRDFLLGDDFSRRCGMRRLTDPSTVRVGGSTVLLSHGDALCTDDIAYQEARRMLRDPVWQSEFLRQTIEQRLEFAQDARQKSEAHTQSADETIMDVSDAAVRELLSHRDLQALIHGHTHRPAHHRIADMDADRWVLPDWRSSACGIVATDGSPTYFASVAEFKQIVDSNAVS